jgi:hypothetical protein
MKNKNYRVEKDIYQVALCWRNSKTKREKNKNKR